MTFEQFLKNGVALGNNDFRLRCKMGENLNDSEFLTILVTPLNRHGVTQEFYVDANQVLGDEVFDEVLDADD